MPIKIPLSQRFWNKVDIGEIYECWEWGAGRDRKGYGTFDKGNRKTYAHRLAYELVYRVEPGKCHVMHTCDNPGCCNPLHLVLGTHARNMADRERKGRGHLHKGSAHPLARLTDDQVRSIRASISSGESLASIGRRYGVGKRTILDIKSRRTWSHLD